MMRPTCAYPPIVQAGLQNGPDMYGDRETLGFGHLAGQGPSVQTMPSTPTIYPTSIPNGSLTNSQVPGQHPAFGLPAYSQVPLQQQGQQAYSAIPSDMMAPGHTFQAQQQQQQYQGMTANISSEKLIQQTIPQNRSTGSLYSRGPNPAGSMTGPTATLTSYGMMQGIGNATLLQAQQQQQQQQQQRLAVSGVGSTNVGRTVLQSAAVTRPGNMRTVGGISDPNCFQNSAVYVSYASNSTIPQPSNNPQIPYSVAISNPTVSVSMSSMVSNSGIPSGPSYGVNQGMVGQTQVICSTGFGRSSCSVGLPPSAMSGMQQPSVYQSQQSRLPNTSSNFTVNSYVNQQQYVPSSSLSFRGGNNAVSVQQAAVMSSHPVAVSSPQLIKGSSGANGVGLPSGLAQQQQQQQPGSQMPSCSTSAAGSPNPGVGPNCKNHGGSGFRPGSNSAGTVFNVAGCPVPNVGSSGHSMTPNAAITPPGGSILIGGPAVMGPVNGCLPMGPDGDIKLNTGVPDGCYIQSRPISSGARDPSMGAITVNGPIGSGGGDLLISPPFQMSAGMNASAAMPYAPAQQIPVLPGEFDPTASNASPLMMMAMPASSPMAAGALINGPVSTPVMNIAMANSAPAPPPYHQPTSLSSCRSMGPSSFFGQTMAMPPVTVTTNVHMDASPAIPVLSDGPTGFVGVGSIAAERHMLGLPTESASTGSSGSKQSGSTKSTNRPKRTRANKSTGSNRGNKANSKKNANSSVNAVALSTSDMYALNSRLPSQPQGRQKVPSWNMGMGPSGVTNFPSGMVSPTLSMPLSGSGDSRGGCISPASFASSNGVLMRPNSGPPVDPGFSNMVPGAGGLNCSLILPGAPGLPESASRLSSSPRQSYASGQPTQGQQQQQQYFPPGTAVPLNGPYVTNGHIGSGVLSNQSVNVPSTVNPSLSQQSLSCYHGNTHSQNVRSQPSSMHFQSHSLQPSNCSISTSLPGPCRPNSQTSTNTLPYSSSGCSAPYASDVPISSRPVGGVSAYSTSASTSASSNETSFINSTGDTDRLVCPITNGMVWGPAQISLNEVMHQYLPDGVYVRRFEFDLTANHLNTIVGRSDLDIVVCSHLLSEPLQVCHWPSDSVQIRFNDYLLRLDRSSVNGGQSAHKVACVKQLCRPGRNYLEIAILGLGEDPNQPAVVAKRRSTAATLEMHRFAAFMAHMPALNVLLDGLQRRRPAGVSTLCDLLEGRTVARMKGLSESDSVPDHNRPAGAMPVVAELGLVCPVFRTRMRVPGRITGCEHIEAFDMEAFLRREVLWPRLSCPICGHKSPAGLDGLCIDTTILLALSLVHPAIDSILVRSDGYWRLPPPVGLDLPMDVDQWQPLIGPLTEVVTHAFNRMAMIRTGPGISPVSKPVQMPSVSQSAPVGGGCPQNMEWSSLDKDSGCVQRFQQQQQQQQQQHQQQQQLQQQQQQQQQKGGFVNRPKSRQGQLSSSLSATSTTPNKELVRSPLWTSSSGSPVHAGLDKFGDTNVEAGTGEIEMLSHSNSVSRPSSQPCHTAPGWLIVRSCGQSSPAGRRNAVTPQFVKSPGVINDSQHQYPLSDPAGTSQTVIPQVSGLQNDILSDSSRTRVPCRAVDSTEILAPKIRRGSTGSTRSENVHLNEANPLPPLQEHSGRQFQNTSSSSCSPVRSVPKKDPGSLPDSPAGKIRPSPTNNFSIPAIPGVNMNVVDCHSSSPNALATTHATDPAAGTPDPRTPTTMHTKGVLRLGQVSTSDIGGVEAGSSVPVLKTEPSVYLSAESASGKVSNRLSYSHSQETASSGDSSKYPESYSSMGAKSASSLNMGLDFLLGEDHSLANPEGLGNSNDQSASSLKNHQDQQSDVDINCVDHVNETATSNHRSIKRTYSSSSGSLLGTITERPTPQLNCTYPGAEDHKKLVHSAVETGICVQDCGSLNVSDSSSCCQLSTESDIKRIKLEDSTDTCDSDADPVSSATQSGPLSSQSSVKTMHECSKVEQGRMLPSSLSQATDQYDGPSKSSDHSPFDREVHSTDVKQEQYVTRTGRLDLASLPLIPTELDEERACSDAVHSLSSQIDRLDIFLEESYVRFVESFPCV